MPGVLEALAKVDLGKLSGKLEIAHGTVHLSGSVSLDPKDLLGDLGPLLQLQVPAQPADLAKAVTAALGELDKLVGLPALGSLDEVGKLLASLTALLEKLATQLSDSDGSLVDKLFGALGGPLGGIEAIVLDLVGRFVDALPLELPEAATVPLKAMAALGAGPPSKASDLAGVLGGFLLGVDLAALQAPSLELDAFLGQVRAAGGDLGLVSTQALALRAQVDAATALLARADADVAGAVALLATVSSGLDALTAAVGGALGRLAADFAALAPEALAKKLGDLLAPLGVIPPNLLAELEAIVEPLRPVAQGIDNLTPDMIRAMFEAVEQSLVQAAKGAGMEELPQGIDDVFEVLVEQLRRVPLRSVRNEVLGAMLDVEARIRRFDGLAMPHQVGDKLLALQAAVERVDVSGVQKRVAAVKETVQATVDGFPIPDIKTEVTAVVASVSSVIKDFLPAVQAVGKQLDDLAKEVAAIDIAGAGEVSISAIHDIRQKVQDVVGSGDVPPPVKAAIGVAAHELKGIDISVKVTAPFHDAIAQLDAKAILAPLEPGMAKVREALAKVTPKSIIAELEQPYEELLGRLHQFKPEALIAGLSSAFGGLIDQLNKADPRALVAPLQAEFEALVAKLRAALDPAPLFAPLVAAYKKLQELVDRIDLEKLFGALIGKVAGLPSSIGGALQGALSAKMGGEAAPPAAGGEFRLGDVLRPFQALVAEVRDALVGLAEGLVSDALGLLAKPLGLLKRLVDPAAGLVAEIARAVDERRALLDLWATGGPLGELRGSIAHLAAVAGSLSLSVDARAQLDGSVASVRLDARAQSLGDAHAALDAPSLRLRGAGGAPELADALRRLENTMSGAVPSALAAPDPDAAGLARLGHLLDILDPTPQITALDELGGKIKDRLATVAGEMTRGLYRVINAVIGLLVPVFPLGLAERFSAGMKRIRDELSVLDPAPIQAEAGKLVDAVLEGLASYAPARLAAQLGATFDAVLAKLAVLDPSQLVGDLKPITDLIAQFEALRPSVVLAPLIDQTKGLQAALEEIAGLTLGGALVEATAKLLLRLDAVVTKVEAEMDGLLDSLGGAGSVSVSVSATGSIGG